MRVLGSNIARRVLALLAVVGVAAALSGCIIEPVGYGPPHWYAHDHWR